MRPAALGIAVLASLIAVPLSAQSYKTMVETRRVAESGPLAVDLTFAVGALLIRPGDKGRTYRLAMTYAEDYFAPVVRFDQRRNALTIELEGEDGRFHGEEIELSDQLLDLALPRDAPLDLDITFGALEAEIELGGLNLRSAKISTGASETTISFSERTDGPCRRMEFNVGAAEFRALQLGNAGCRTVTFRGGVGEVLLDLSGERIAEMDNVVATVGLGEVTIRVPEAIGVRLDADRFLASIDHDGFVKRGGYYVTPNFDSAATTITIEVNAVLGSIEIQRIP